MSSFTIGGIDLIMQGPKSSDSWRTILEMGFALWPNAVFQDGDEESTHSLAEILSEEVPRSSEFFIYKDDANAKSWSDEGLTPANTTFMLHFLLFDDPERPNQLEITA